MVMRLTAVRASVMIAIIASVVASSCSSWSIFVPVLVEVVLFLSLLLFSLLRALVPYGLVLGFQAFRFPFPLSFFFCRPFWVPLSVR